MFKPCEHCEKADNRSGYFKCDRPCDNARQCFKRDSDLFNTLAGYIPRIKKYEGDFDQYEE